MTKKMHLPLSFFQNPDVGDLAQRLIGKILVTERDGIRTSGIIVETEAYRGADDRACHAYQYRRTPRTETMFKAGGHAYVYLCYGIHPLFNIVAHSEGEPDAVLIRALAPLEGIEIMKERRPKIKAERLASGPGCLTKALGIEMVHNALVLQPGSGLWLEENTQQNSNFSLEARTRIGVDYAGEDAKRLWRFLAAGHPSVSRK
jgi:DNA-3-methyladenine glycosylase